MIDAATASPSIEDRLVQRAHAIELQRLLHTVLSRGECAVLARVTGLDGDGGRSCRALATEWKVSVKAIRQMYAGACARLAEEPSLRDTLHGLLARHAQRTIGRRHDQEDE